MLSKWLKKNLNLIFLAVFCWSLPFAWIFAIPKHLALLGGQEVSIKRLQLTSQNINQFAREFKRAPRNLNEIRLYSRANQRSFHAYDGYGHIIEYQPLDEGTFLIRSFGEDEVEFRKGLLPDYVLSNLLKEIPKGINAAEKKRSGISVFNPAFLQGAFSPDGTWHARLYVNADTGVRKLVLRERNSKSLMISLHDRVEEFLWRSDSESIIFSATGSPLYKDGIYEWSLKTGTAVNILDGQLAKFDMHGLATSKNFLISLAGFDDDNQSVYAFIGVDQGHSVDPDLFYSDQALINISLKKNRNEEFDLNENRFTASSFHKFMEKSYRQWQRVAQGQETSIQKAFLGLPVRGDVASILDRWTEFSAQHRGNAVLFPYLNLHLCIWYGYASLAQEGRDAEVLRTYGAEFSRALATDQLSPRYMQALAAHIHKRLIGGGPVPELIQELKL